MEEGLVAVEKRVRANLEKAGLDRGTILLLEEAAKILEDLKASGYNYIHSQSFRLGVLLAKISEKTKEDNKGGER